MYRGAAELSNDGELTQENKMKILDKLKVFFGPHKFRKVFQSAIVFSFELHQKKLKDFYFPLENEPLFDQILSFMILDKQLSLKYKAKIPIPQSAVLIGTID